MGVLSGHKALSWYVPLTLLSVGLCIAFPHFCHFVFNISGLLQHAMIAMLAAGVVVFFFRFLVGSSMAIEGFLLALRSCVGFFTLREAVFISVLSAVSEEIVFRGFMQPVFGLIGTSLLFALLHTGPSPKLWLWPVMAFLVSMWLGSLYMITHNLWVPMLTHACVNFIHFRWYFNNERAKASMQPIMRGEVILP